MMRVRPGAILLLIVGFASGVGWTLLAPGAGGASRSGQRAAAAGSLNDVEQATVSLFERAAPSVVFITSLALRRDAFRLDVTQIPRGNGSGFLWDTRGHVVTNFHVVQGADALRVTLADQSAWDARLVGAAPEKDLAVLRIDAPAELLRPLPIGSA